MTSETQFMDIITGDLEITVPAATVAAVPKEVRHDIEVTRSYLQRATEIGVMAMAQAGINLESDVVKSEFAQFTNTMNEISKGLENLLADELTDDDSRLARQLHQYFSDEGRLGTTVRRLTEQLGDPSREHSIPGSVRKLLHDTFFASDAPFLRALDITDDSSPLKRFVGDQHERLKNFQEDQVKKHNMLAATIEANFKKVFDHIGYQSELAEAEDKGTRKGGEFEEVVTEVLASAATNKDVIERVGKEAIDGTRCKRGDVVVDIRQDGLESQRIVVEAKSGTYTLNGKDGALNQLTVAMNYRGAAGGILVVTRSHAGKRQRAFDRLGDNQIVVVVDPDDEDGGFLPLEVAYAVLRDQLLVAKDDGDTSGPDLVGASATVAELLTSLNMVTSMKSNCTEATKNITNVREAIGKLETGVREKLTTLKRQLQLN